MLKELIKLANHLDSKGLAAQASTLDVLIKKLAEEEAENDEVLWNEYVAAVNNSDNDGNKGDMVRSEWDIFVSKEKNKYFNRTYKSFLEWTALANKRWLGEYNEELRVNRKPSAYRLPSTELVNKLKYSTEALSPSDPDVESQENKIEDLTNT